MTKMIRGAGGGKSGGGATPRTPVEAADTLRSSSFARVLDLISEGEIEGLVSGLQSVYLDGTPIENPDGSMNFTGVSMNAVNGTQAQQPIPGFIGTEQEFAVGTEVTFGTPVTRTITSPEADAARIRIAIPALSRQDTVTGDITGTEVVVAIHVQSNGGGFVAQHLSRQWHTLANGIAFVLGVGVKITVEWSLTNNFAFHTVKFDVQYRQAGAGSWTTYKNDSFTSAQTFSNRGPRFTGALFTISRTYTITDLPELFYEARVVITSGPGTLSIPLFQVLTAVPIDTIRGKASSTYQRSYRVPLTGSPPWDIRVSRVTPDSATNTLQNKTFFDSYAELTDEKFSYPNSALIGLSIDAEQFSSIPSRGYDVKLLRVKIPSNYDPVTREYDGIWDGTFTVAWTDNPAWCFYDLLTKTRYGLGTFLSPAQVDKWALYAIGQYCDGLVPDGQGGMEPRFTCNLYLQTRAEAFQVIVSMASIFRAMAYWAAGTITAAQDSPTDPVFQFTEANVENGLFTYSGSAKSARHTVALVSWNDPEDGYKLKPEYVEDVAGIARYGVSSIELTAVGCASRGQARRVGEWLLYSERRETEVVMFRCGHDGTYLRPGNIFAVQDQHRAGVRYGGRLVSATASSVTIDAPITISGGQTYTIQVVLPDGTLETKTLTNAPGSATVLTISVNFAVIPLAQSVWLITSTALSPRLYRCISIVEAERQTYEVTGVAHDPSKFDYIERDIPLVSRNFSSLSIVPATPQNVVISESMTIRQGIVVVIVTIRWDPVPSASRYRVEYRRDNGNYVSMPEVSHSSVEILNASAGFYEVRVIAKNVLNLSSAAAGISSRHILGKTVPPADVTGFAVMQLEDRLLFNWNGVSDLDLDYYEIRRGFSWNSAIYVTTSNKQFVEVVTHPIGTFFIKAIDTSGNPSVNAASVTINNPFAATHVGGLSSSTSWPGTHSDTVGTSDGLTLVDTTNWLTLGNAWTTYTAHWATHTALVLSGTYVTEVFDFGGVGIFKPVFNALLVEQLLARGNTWSVHTRPWLEYTHPWMHAPSKVTVTIELGTNQTGSVLIAAYAFAPYFEGFVKARSFRFRFTLTTTDPNYIPRLTSFAANFYLRQRVVPFKDLNTVAGGTTITFSPSFALDPTVTGTIQNGVIGDTFKVTNKTESQATLTIYDSAGGAKDGEIDVNVVGVGDVF